MEKKGRGDDRQSGTKTREERKTDGEESKSKRRRPSNANKFANVKELIAAAR